jgi:hypothetical protein
MMRRKIWAVVVRQRRCQRQGLHCAHSSTGGGGPRSRWRRSTKRSGSETDLLLDLFVLPAIFTAVVVKVHPAVALAALPDDAPPLPLVPDSPGPLAFDPVRAARFEALAPEDVDDRRRGWCLRARGRPAAARGGRARPAPGGSGRRRRTHAAATERDVLAGRAHAWPPLRLARRLERRRQRIGRLMRPSSSRGLASTGGARS